MRPPKIFRTTIHVRSLFSQEINFRRRRKFCPKTKTPKNKFSNLKKVWATKKTQKVKCFASLKLNDLWLAVLQHTKMLRVLSQSHENDGTINSKCIQTLRFIRWLFYSWILLMRLSSSPCLAFPFLMIILIDNQLKTSLLNYLKGFLRHVYLTHLLSKIICL